MAQQIYLFRHGQTTYNKSKRHTGWQNAQLTEKGKQHAGVIAKQLVKQKISVAFQTSLSRSQDTLRIVLQQHPECYATITDDRMIERSYGKLERRLHASVIAESGKVQFDLWHRGYDVRPPGGESFADVEKRVHSFIVDVKKFVRKEKIDVAISAHGNSIRLFRKIMERASKQEACSWKIPFATYFHYQVK